MNLNTFYCFLIIFLFGIANAITCISQPANPCTDCPLPRHPQSKATPSGDKLIITFKNNQRPIYGMNSIKRSTIKRFDRLLQSITIKRVVNGICTDTVIVLDEVEEIRAVGLGMGGQTLVIPVYSAREFFMPEQHKSSLYRFVEVSSNIGFYGTSKERNEIVGFSSPIFGFSGAIAPFGNALGNDVQLLLGGGIFFENGRMRIPITSQLRFVFLGNLYEEEFNEYRPNACKFGITGEKKAEIEPNVIEVPQPYKQDSTVYFVKKTRIIKDEYRPYFFIEGGPIFNGSFDGNGSSPSLNSENYSQYTFAAGLGLTLLDNINVSLGYRLMRLNLRLPCIACQESYVVNTNLAQGIFMSVGMFFNY